MVGKQAGTPSGVVAIADLGPIRIDGHPLESIVRSPSQRAIFVALVLARSQGGIRADRLEEFVWPERPPSRRRLWDAVHRLRAVLASSGTDLEPINVGGRYRFDRRVLLDSERFEALVAEANALTEFHPRRARDVLDAALQLWRGDPYDGHDPEPLMPGLVQSLDASRQAAERLRARMVIALSGPESAISDLEALASDRPFDEDVVELLVVALRDSGRRIDALQRIRRFKSQLIDAMGIEPGARLAGLERDLVSVAFTDAELTTRSRERPIRRWTNSLVGRSQEAEQLIELIGTHRLVTVVGPGGVGKTRLAVEVSNQGSLDRRTTLVDLTATVDPSNIDAVVTTALGLSETTSRTALRRFLERSPHLIVLDNCEHLVDAAARLVGDLLTGTTSTRVLATSRVPLRLPEEHLLRLAPLDAAPTSSGSAAAELFCHRAELEYAELPKTDRQLVDEVTTRLDGLPLAIELAAARAPSLGLDGLASGLDDRFELLSTGQRHHHQRHRSLEAMLSWSANLLDDDTRAVLAGCTAFVGSFSLTDAIAVSRDRAIGDGTVRRAVADLVDANMIERDPRPNPYRCLETIRHFGRDRLLGPSGADEASNRHASHFVDRAVSLAGASYGPGEAAVLDELVAQADEYRAALGHLRTNQDWDRLADLVWGASTVAFSLRGAWPEPVFAVADLVDVTPTPTSPRWGALLSVVASTLHRRDYPKESAELGARAIELAPDSHLPWVHTGIALVPLDPVAAVRTVTRALEVSDPDRPEELLPSLWGLTNVRRRTGDVDGAFRSADRLVQESRRLGTERGEAIGLTQLAYLHPTGSAEGAESARRAVELGIVSRTPAAEKTAALLHVQHLLRQDPMSARSPLLIYLRRPAVHTPFGPAVVAAAGAFFALTGDSAIATELFEAVGQNQLSDLVDLEPVQQLLHQVPAHIDPMSIDLGSLEAMTERALDRLHEGA